VANSIMQGLLWDVIPYRNSPCLRTPNLDIQHNETIFPVAVRVVWKHCGFIHLRESKYQTGLLRNQTNCFPLWCTVMPQKNGFINHTAVKI